MGAAGGVAIGAAGGVAIAVAGGVASGVAAGVEIGVAGGVEIGVAAGVAIGVAAEVTGEVAGGLAAAGTKNNSKSLTRMGIDGTGDSAACGCAELREIPEAEVRTKKKIRMAQANSPWHAGEKNMRDSVGQVSLQHTRCAG